jgi:hypothetical protein
MTSPTVTTDLSPKVQAYYDRRFLIRAKQNLVAYQHAQLRNLPQANGKTVYYTRYKPLEKVTAALTESRTGGLDPNTRQVLRTEEINATIAKWGDYVELTDLALKTSIDPNVSEKVDIVSVQAAESIDYDIMKNLATRGLRRRADADATYQKNSVTTGAGTTTTIVDTALTEIDDFWNGGFVTITNPLSLGYGETRQITDFDAASDTVTVSPAFSVAPGTGAYYRIVVGTGIVAGDKLTTTVVRLALRDLGVANAMKYEKGYWIAFIDPYVQYDFMGDTDWVNAATYKDSADNLYNGEIGKWFGIRFVSTTALYRETVAGVEADGTGAVHVCPIIGREAYGAVRIDGNEPKIVLRDPAQLGQPLNMTSTVGWELKHATKVLNSNFVVNTMLGATN